MYLGGGRVTEREGEGRGGRRVRGMDRGAQRGREGEWEMSRGGVGRTQEGMLNNLEYVIQEGHVVMHTYGH